MRIKFKNNITNGSKFIEYGYNLKRDDYQNEVWETEREPNRTISICKPNVY